MNKFTESYKSVDIDQACVVVLASAWKRRKICKVSVSCLFRFQCSLNRLSLWWN